MIQEPSATAADALKRTEETRRFVRSVMTCPQEAAPAIMLARRRRRGLASIASGAVPAGLFCPSGMLSGTRLSKYAKAYLLPGGRD